ncbi:MAG: DUF1552 domain-containing protein [Akkermansiaceae bacterium]
MINRRQILKRLGLGTGACSLTPFLSQLRAEARANGDPAKLPKRFVFVLRANGVLTNEILPEGVENVKERPHAEDLQTWVDVPLAGKKLAAGMSALEPFRDKLTLIQGLSGRMMSGAHEAGFGALGAYNGKRVPRAETIDWALASQFGGVVPRIGLTMEQFGKSVTYPNLSASGPRKALPYYADPMLAYIDLFGTIATGGAARTAIDLDRNILDFMIDDVKRYQKILSSAEKEKMGHYLNGFETLKERQAKLKDMGEQLKAAAPELRDHFTSEIEMKRLEAHFDLAASSLIVGLTNVTTIRCDHLGMRLSGLGLGNKTVHHIGHMIENGNDGHTGEAFGGDASKWGEFKTREVIMQSHMGMIAGLWKKLQAVPEGNGTMADNTAIIYFSDHGDRHHSPFKLWPMTVLGDAGGSFKTGRYLQYPGHRRKGNQTIGNFYLSLLHAAGDKRMQFGALDLESPDYINQKSPLAEWMA